MDEEITPGNILKRMYDKAKPLEELILEQEFVVKEVISNNYQILTNPYSETVFGEKCLSYPTGMNVETILKVQGIGDYRNSPIKTLKFQGNTAVVNGDEIIARIPVFNREDEFLGFHDEEEARHHYFEREVTEEEEAIEIQIYEDEDLLRTDRSSTYHQLLD